MRFLNNEKGIALITTLMLTMIALVISMVMLYLTIQWTQMSGSQKMYKNSLEAANGGVDIVIRDALPVLVGSVVDNNGSVDYFRDALSAALNLNNITVNVSNSCFTQKLTLPTEQWSTDCSAQTRTLDAKNSPDFSFSLQSQITGFVAPAGFTVYTKIVSTTPGSTDMSGRNLEGMATTGAPPLDVGSPYLYRIEVTGEKTNNPKERANLSVLYAY
jgi:Tfp pilus assembly protein PilX